MSNEILPDDPRKRIKEADYVAVGRKPLNCDLTDPSTWTALVSAIFTVSGALGIQHDKATVTAVSAIVVFGLKAYNFYRAEYKSPLAITAIPTGQTAKIDVVVKDKEVFGTNADAIISVRSTARDDVY